jgi:cytochrome c biogenesis protein CcmG/thiol:disulfide interchange protein DsbE
MYEINNGLKLLTTFLLFITFTVTGCWTPQTEQAKQSIQADQPIQTTQTIKTPPKISNVRVSKSTDSSAWVTWTTDRPATSEIKFWEDGTKDQHTITNDDIVTVHFNMITLLDKEKVYTIEIKAKDSNDQQLVSEYKGVFSIKIGPQVNQNAPDFELPNISHDDESLALNHFRGRIALLVFWDINCLSCKKKMPLLQKKFKQIDNNNFIIITVHVPGQEAEIKSYCESQGLTLPVLLDADGKVSASYEVLGLPASFVIDQSGIICAKDPEFATQEELDKLLDQYISR